MTADVDGHKEQLEAAAKSVAAKLQSFHDGLTPDEQQVLALALRQDAAQTDEPAGDTSGHLILAAGPLGPLAGVANPVVQTAIAVEQVRSMLRGLGLL